MGLVDSFEKLRSVFEQNEKVIEPRIVKLFRFLNEEKKNKKNEGTTFRFN